MRALIAATILLFPASAPGNEPVRIASKADTETTIIASIAANMVRDAGFPVELKLRLGGTRFVWDALLANSVDIYPEYTGTLLEQIFANRKLNSLEELNVAMSAHGLRMTKPLGFTNNYALGMKRQRALELGIRTISDLVNHPALRFGFSSEFISRADGWPGLQQSYGLPQKNVIGMDHRLAYEALSQGTIDLTELYTTDAEIRRFDLVPLEDDRHFFPRYEAVLVYRADLEQRAPAAVAALKRLENAFTETGVIAMNAQAADGATPSQIASEFVRSRFHIDAPPDNDTDGHRLWVLTQQHLTMVVSSLAAAISIALPLGIVAAHRPRLGQLLIGVAGVIQTIPALALLVFMIPLLKTGTTPAIVALFLYSLLPIMSNTAVGLRGIPPALHDAAESLGLSKLAQLYMVELPIAAPSILAGIRTAAVINIGTATLGALIGAGGYGQPIQTGLQMNDHREILFGAVPAAVMALLAQLLFGLLELILVSRGLRLRSAT